MSPVSTSNGNDNGNGASTGTVERVAATVRARKARAKEGLRTKDVPSSVRAIDGPFLYGRDYRTWYWVELPTLPHYDHRLLMDKDSRIENLRTVLQELPGYRLHVIGNVEDLPIEEIVEKWREQLVFSANDAMKQRHAELMVTQAEELKGLTFRGYKQRRIYVGIELKADRRFSAAVISQIEKALGEDPVISNGDTARLYAKEVRRLHRVFAGKGLHIRPLTVDETCGLVQRSVLRGHSQLPPLRFKGDEPVKGKSALTRLARSSAYDHGEYLRIKHRGQSSYVSYMAIATLPDDFKSEWLFQTNELNDPVEFSVRINVEPAGKAKSRLQRDKRLLISQREGLNPDDAQEDIERIENDQALVDLALQYAKGGKHTLHVDAQLIVSGETPEQVEASCDHLISVNLSDQPSGINYSVEFDIDNANQHEMRESSHPGSAQVYSDHTQRLDAEAMAASMFHASSRFGNGGAYVGVVVGKERYPLLFSHHRSIKWDVDNNIVQVITGSLGSGKTFTMLQMAATDAKDGFVVIFDEGKGDTALMGDIPGVASREFEITNYPGILNPGTLAGRIIDISDKAEYERAFSEKHEAIAETLTRFAKKAWDDSWQGALNDAINLELGRDEASFRRPDLYRLVRWLQEQPAGTDAHRLGGALSVISRARNADLFFSNKFGPEDIKGLFAPGTITRTIYSQLDPPDTLNKDYRDDNNSQALSREARYRINYLYNRVALDRDQPVSIYKDEFHLDLRLGGMGFVERIARIGRAFQTVLTVGSQSLVDFPEEFFSYVSAVIAMRQVGQGSEKARMLSAKYVGLNLATEASRIHYLNEFEKMGRGDAFMSYTGGGVARVRFLDIHLKGAFISNQEALHRLFEEARAVAMARRQRGGPMYVGRARNHREALEGLAVLGLNPELVIKGSKSQQALARQITQAMESLQPGQYLSVDDNGRLQVTLPTGIGLDGMLQPEGKIPEVLTT